MAIKDDHAKHCIVFLIIASMPLMSSTTTPVLFIHVPKTAGISVVHTLGKTINKRIHSMKTTAEEYIKEHDLENYLKFGFKRNPYSRFISLFSYFKAMLPDHPYYRYNEPIVNVVSRFKCIDDFADNFYDLRLCKNFHFKPQSDYLLNTQGDSLVDFLGSVENFEGDLKEIASLIGINNAHKIIIQSKNVTNKKEPIPLSRSVIKLVNNFYSRDLVMLNYKLLEL